ncbi:MAG: SusD/RagB family nutrient-binding outer membrane lipoprotein [Bacteroidota bacterium]|nr:SusD/RagB family nutrient-binding outer membrane lipoprotein [Bacteroidota bacterium]
MKKIRFITTIILGLSLASCDSYLDINQDPNSPSEKDITSAILLPGAEMNVAASYGDYYRITGGYFSQHFSQDFGTSNYLDYSQFSQSATRSSSSYTQLTQRGLKNLQTVREKALASQDWGTYLAATTLRVFVYQALVDAYGEVPYTEALDANNLSPKYDEGKDIYAGILAELDEALSHVDKTMPVSKNFLYPGETAGKWIQFANALKLRILTRESGVADVNGQIATLIQEGNFPTADVAYKNCWKDESGAMSPYYAEEFSTKWGSTQKNVIANIALQGTMQTSSYTDPRFAAWFEPNSDGNYTGAVSGSNFSTSKLYKAAYWCRPIATFDMPVYLITLSDINFYISEYYAKAGNGIKAKQYYEDGIRASFAQAGVDGADQCIRVYPYDQTNYKKCIGIAKWVALAGTNDFEAYCELRRLRYPAFGTVTGKDLYDGANDASYAPSKYVPGTLYTPYLVFGEVGSNKLLERWPYAESSTSRNSNAPSFKGYTTPIFWAVK